ncbi:hypothetical protein FHT98_2502 [Bosea sp. AK1]|uniref:DUF1772 domain-containing protein n=1 Tax=Bosea sp. AK1 TaxID=2587160 RepID=UPI00114DBDE5|nr:DUF1772 domain-containing protein [Bosea sp. AK1]TQI74739.1 hypothetical protein FHT98_2502 [Bosea sp. AK1]
MFLALSILGLLLVAVTMGLSLAHALEFPGKLRLDETTYRAVQAIYFPGFTIGGLVGEVGGMVVLAILLFFTPTGTERFWWTTGALGLLIAVHATYWLVTHSVNSAWLKDSELGGTSQLIFGLFSSPDSDWRHMRNVWEWSHVLRACFATLGLLSMSVAIAQ